MSDMRSAIEPKSDQWNFDDFTTGPLTFKITGVKIKGGQEQPVDISLEGTPKFYRPCKSMSRCLVAAWGADANKYIGRSLTLYGDPKVRWGGLEVGGIRISHMSHIDAALTMALTATKGNKKPFTVKPMEAAVVAPADSEKESTLRFALENAGMTEAWFLAQTGKQSLSEVTHVPKALSWIADERHAEPKP